MSGADQVYEFRSGAGRPCLDFVRTLRRRGDHMQTEELPDPAALAAWVSRFGPVGPVSVAAVRGRDEQARLLRESIYELISAARTERGVESCSAPARDRVNVAAAQPSPAPFLDEHGRLSWHARDPVQATLALLARDAVDLVTSSGIRLVRECAGAECKALFFDASRPGTRRWCSMNTCGNKSKKDSLRRKSPILD